MTSPRRSMHRGHNSMARPDEQMGRLRATWTSLQNKGMKREANKKRRQRDTKVIKQEQANGHDQEA